MELRYYQAESVARTMLSLRDSSSNPLVVLPPGAGKSATMGAITAELGVHRSKKLIIAHRLELVEQNYNAVKAINSGASVSIYSNSAGEKDFSGDVVVASIQSLAALPSEKLPEFSHLLIDECHMVNTVEMGEYRRIISALNTLRRTPVIGMSATPYRLAGGYLHKAKDRIFTEIAHAVPMAELIEKGYLSPFAHKDSIERVDTSEISVHKGDFAQYECDQAFNNTPLITAAIQDILSYAKGRDSWIVFCTSVDHAHKVMRELWRYGVSAVTVTGDTHIDERKMIVQQFREKKIRAICNYDVLSTGFDAPNVDMVVLLRPTKSPGLYVQMVGRGTRLYPNKKDCLVLDYGQNIERFGPVDKVKVKQVNNKAVAETIPLKVCPDCREVIGDTEKICSSCGKVFPVVERKRTLPGTRASNLEVLRGSLMKAKFDGKQILQVVKHSVVLHQKLNKPTSVRVDYYLNMLDKVSEWICPEHTGYAKTQALKWWNLHTGNDDMPETAEDLRYAMHNVGLAQKIVVELDNDFPRIITRYRKDSPFGGVTLE
jgi:DNA repair protein RadD